MGKLILAPRLEEAPFCPSATSCFIRISSEPQSVMEIWADGAGLHACTIVLPYPCTCGKLLKITFKMDVKRLVCIRAIGPKYSQQLKCEFIVAVLFSSSQRIQKPSPQTWTPALISCLLSALLVQVIAISSTAPMQYRCRTLCCISHMPTIIVTVLL